MSAPGPYRPANVAPPPPLRTTLRNPRLWLYWLLIVAGLMLIAQSAITLILSPPASSAGRIAAAISGFQALWGLAVVAAMLWFIWSTRRIEISFAADGITSHVRPGFTVRWSEIRAVRLLRVKSWVQLAIVETPEARGRRRVPWWSRDIGVPRKTLIASFPVADEPAVRAILAAHGVVPQPFLPAD